MADKVKLSTQCRDCHENPRMQNSERPRRRYERCEDCRRSHTLARLNARRVKRTLKGSERRPVQFNQGDGWRVGYLLSLGTYKATVQPIGALKGICPQTLEVALADLKPEPCQSASMPTVEDYYRMTAAKKVPVLVVQPAKFNPIIHGSEPLQTLDGTLVQKTAVSTEYPPLTVEVRNINEGAVIHRPANAVVQPKVGVVKHPPVNEAEVIRLWQLTPRPPMKDIVNAVRGQRAEGATGNLVRAILEKAGLYQRPVKEPTK